MTEPGTAVAPRTAVQALVESRQDDFTAILPKHVSVETFMGLAVAYIRRDPNLIAAARSNPASLIIALRECAALGHVPMKGTYSLVAYGGKNPSVTGIEEVRGTIQRMYRAGGVQSVHVQLVREHDQFDWTPAMSLPFHRFDPLAGEETRGPIVGVYAWARMREGGVSQVVVMGMADVARYESAAKTRKFWDGPWRPEMIQKTALHRLEKFVPTSAEYLWQRVAAEAGAAKSGAGLPDRPAVDSGDDVIEGEADWPETAAPPDGDGHAR